VSPIRIAIVGFGKIARDQHVRAIAATDGGPLKFSAGGARLIAGSEVLVDAPEAEYRGLYRRFVELTATGISDVDLTPLRLVADALMLGRRRIAEPFED